MKRILGVLLIVTFIGSLPAFAQNVNTVVPVPSATGTATQLRATGSDTNIAITVQPKGSGSVNVKNRVTATQTTVPTCAPQNCSMVGSDFFMQGTLGTGLSDSNTATITFNGTFTTAPMCTGMLNTAVITGSGHPYYIYSVASTTTTATVSFGGGWGTGMKFTIGCVGPTAQ